MKSKNIRMAIARLTLATFTLSLTAASLAQQRPAKVRSTFTTETVERNGSEITIVRDDYGVPHVFAASEQQAYFGGGYAAAEDRLFQMERFRRNARGRLAELEGPGAFASDRETVTNGYDESELQSQIDRQPKEVGESLQAYADGVNAFIERAAPRNELPLGFSSFKDGRPEHWKAVDCAAIAIMMAQRFGSMGGSEAEKARVLKFLREKFGDDGYRIFDDLFWRNDPKAPVTIPETDTSVGGAGVLETGPQVAARNNERQRRMIATANDESLIQASDVAEERGIISYAAGAGLPTRWGSYALAVSGGKSISGNAILLAGPQMGFTTPSIAYEIHYSAPNLNVVGMTIPGIPQILIGHNNFLAWTATSGFVDEVDIFAERLNPQNKYQYMFKGRYIDMNRRSESISVKGEAQPRQVEVYRTVHGPVVSWDEANRIAYSRAASYAGNELGDMTAARGFGLSRNTTEFAGYAGGIYTSRNYLVATISGDIGFWSCGKPPIRDKSIDPRLPVPGGGAYEWKGLRPFSQMPQAVNPKQGYLFNWNNKPERDWDSEGDAVWGEVEYCTRIDQLVKQHDKLTVDDVRDIAQDISTFDIVAYWLKPYLLSAIRNSETKTRDERLRQAADYMRAWDNHIRDDSVGTTITRLAIVKVREAVFGDELGDLNKAFPRFGQDTPLQHFVQMSVVLRALEGKNAGLALYHDYFHGRQKDAVLVKAINDSLDLSTSVVGQQMNLWKWQQCEIRFGLTGNIPNSNRGTYIEMVELSQPLIRAESVLAPGESEDSRSRHFADQREMAGYWRFKDLIYQAEQFDRPSLHSIECQ